MDKKKILVIDDENDLVFLIKNVLEETGKFEIFSADNGEEGLRLCQQQNPDLIFLDFVMPKMRGDEVLKALTRNPQTQKIPVVVMSGLGELVYVQKKKLWKWLPNRPIVQDRGKLPDALAWEKDPEQIAKKLGVKAFLAKPFTSNVLLEITDDIFEKVSAPQDSGEGTPP
jgi:CheY-like chemotaxis protein